MAHQSTAALSLNYAVDRDWRPLAFSKTGSFSSAPVVFAGYGIVAPATDRFETYDALAGLDVANAWVLVLRYLAEEISVNLKSRGQLPLRRDLLFAAWSGEELGLLGSMHFTRTFGGTPDEPASLAPQVVAYLNCYRLLPEGRASPQRFHRCARRLSHAV
jgi:Peptidase family M28